MFITTAIMLAACESYSSSEKGRENPVDMNNMTESMVVSEDKPDEQEKYPLEAPTEWNSKVKVEGTRAKRNNRGWSIPKHHKGRKDP